MGHAPGEIVEGERKLVVGHEPQVHRESGREAHEILVSPAAMAAAWGMSARKAFATAAGLLVARRSTSFTVSSRRRRLPASSARCHVLPCPGAPRAALPRAGGPPNPARGRSPFSRKRDPLEDLPLGLLSEALEARARPLRRRASAPRPTRSRAARRGRGCSWRPGRGCASGRTSRRAPRRRAPRWNPIAPVVQSSRCSWRSRRRSADLGQAPLRARASRCRRRGRPRRARRSRRRAP